MNLGLNLPPISQQFHHLLGLYGKSDEGIIEVFVFLLVSPMNLDGLD
jgi:hypothetical protein